MHKIENNPSDMFRSTFTTLREIAYDMEYYYWLITEYSHLCHWAEK
jgi:hypothetical protein